MKRLLPWLVPVIAGLVIGWLWAAAHAQLAGNPLAAAGAPTFTGVVTFTADPEVHASLNVGDIVSNGTGTQPPIFTGARAQLTRGNVNGIVGRQLISGWSEDLTNRSTVLEFIGDGSAGSKQYVFLNGHLGTGSTFTTPVLTSVSAGAFGIESTDTGMSLITASAGSNQAIQRALTITTAGVPVPPSLGEPLPVCGVGIQGAEVFDTTLATKQLCVCTAVPRWCVTTVPGCTTGTTTACGTS